MLSKARQLLSRPAKRRGPAGSGLFDRVRATTFAMLGGTAAFCLVLVALLSQQGVPYLPALPIPGANGGDEAVSGGSAVARIGDPINVRIPAPAGVPAGPDRIPAGESDGADSGGRDAGSSRPDNEGSAPDPGSSPDVGSGDGGQSPASNPPPTSSPQSSPVSNPSPGGSSNGSGSQSGSGANAEADAVSAAGGSGSKPVSTPPTTATTAAQQAAAPPAVAPPAPPPSSPSAAEEAAAEEAAVSP
ncbi:MAG TPA: hypothetical protein VMS60_05355 [Solirubrobacterales bacterium]|nr:hypothetical protein [Solirubrobacterales bacterium]